MQSLSSLQGGSNLEGPGDHWEIVCLYTNLLLPSVVKEDLNPSSKDKPIYAGVSPHSRRLADD